MPLFMQRRKKKGLLLEQNWLEERERETNQTRSHCVFTARYRPELWCVERSDQSGEQQRLAGI